MTATLALRSLILALAALAVLKGGQVIREFPGLDGSVPARAAGTAMAANPPAPAAAAPAPTPPVQAGRAAAEEPPPAPDAVAAALRNRREALDSREAALATREAVLAAAERRLAARIEELTALQSRAERAEGEAREREEAHWRGLARLYEIMRPRDAAAVLNELDLPVLAQLVDRMGERRAAPILGAMQPERVRQVTLELSRLRAARPPAN